MTPAPSYDDKTVWKPRDNYVCIGLLFVVAIVAVWDIWYTDKHYVDVVAASLDYDHTNMGTADEISVKRVVTEGGGISFTIKLMNNTKHALTREKLLAIASEFNTTQCKRWEIIREVLQRRIDVTYKWVDVNNVSVLETHAACAGQK